jgi:hypothetical protein
MNFMKSITIHGMDDELDQLIRKKAAEEQKSLNKTIKGLLEEALGVRPSKDHREEFSDLFGTWSTADRQQFEQATEDLRRVDPEDWK